MSVAMKLWTAAAAGALALSTPALASAVPAHGAQSAARPTARSAASAAQPAPRQAGQPATDRACSASAKPGWAACMSLIRTGITERKGVQPAAAAPAGYGPADLQSAYSLPSGSAGAGQTVAIVDAYDDPNAEADLGTYRSQYGLPACTTASGCFAKVNQEGQQDNYPAADSGWATEESLDIDMVSAICPSCHILLVEADDPSIENLGTAVNEAVALGAKFISNSYATSGEDPTETSWDQYYDHPGVAITASAGDAGYQVNFPAVSPDVTAVGGTSLTRDATSSRGWTESVWSGTGSGCSGYESKPAWQDDTGCANRTVADVSAVADPATGVAVYDSYGQGGWLEVGGTSVSSPLIASVYALAGTPGDGTVPAQYPYDSVTVGASGLNDVTSGSNGTCTTAYWCTGEPGYDGPTGLGTPNGLDAFTYRAHGDVAGTVTDAATGSPVAGAQVQAADRGTVTDASGHYDLNLPASDYQVTVSDYGYSSQTATVTVAAAATATKDFALAGTPHQVVSGAVTAGDGHPWPLYASVAWSDGAGHGGTVYTDPATGKYSVSLLQDAKYTLTVTARYPGYQAATKQVDVAETGVTADVPLPVDMLACTAIGYHPVYSGGTKQGFDAGKLPSGWRLANTDLRLPGYSDTPGWQFTNPGNRVNETGGTGNFAIVDSDHAGPHHYQDTTLTTPVVDMSQLASPELEFSTSLQPAVNSTATVEVSVDGGAHWATIWQQSRFPGAPGPRDVVIALPKAAGQAKVLARFSYLGEWSQYWQIDDVFLGGRTCAQQDGGLVIGRVADATSGAPLNGATVSGGGSHAVTVDTPGDDAIGGGFYWLFSTSAGSQACTASMSGYADSSATVTVTNGDVTRQDFTLSAT